MLEYNLAFNGSTKVNFSNFIVLKSGITLINPNNIFHCDLNLLLRFDKGLKNWEKELVTVGISTNQVSLTLCFQTFQIVLKSGITMINLTNIFHCALNLL